MNFQARVRNWTVECFGKSVADNKKERNHRFLEESLELVQSLGCTKEEAMLLVDYVYGREIGRPGQEIGGVMVTLAALGNANILDIEACAELELDRCNRNIALIRAKQALKPKNSPLPGKS